MRLIAQALSLSSMLLLAGCAGGQSLLEQPTPSPVVSTIDMPGRWFLSAPDAPYCGMTFSMTTSANEGTVLPDGGCPGQFFTSRNWKRAGNTLTITDYQDQMLATLTYANDGFAGKSVNDLSIKLKR